MYSNCLCIFNKLIVLQYVIANLVYDMAYLLVRLKQVLVGLFYLFHVLPPDMFFKACTKSGWREYDCIQAYRPWRDNRADSSCLPRFFPGS